MIRKILRYLLNFVLSVLILILIILNIFSITIFDREYIKQKLKSNDFYIRAYSDIIESFENYTMQSGLDLNILDGLVSETQVANDINVKIDSFYTKINGDIDTTSIRNELDSRINKALEENNRVPSDTEKEAINKYEDAIVQAYEDGIVYGTNLSVKVEYLNRLKAICIVSIIVVSIMIILIRRKILRCVACLGISFLFSGIFSVVLKFLLINRIGNILILDTKFSALLINVLTDILNKFFNVGLVIGVVGIIFILIGNIKVNKKA